MASLRVHPDRLEVRLTASESVLGFHRGAVVIPRSAVRSATITHDAWSWIRGVRVVGSGIPAALAIGTWKFHGGTDFLLVKAGRPALVLDLEVSDENPYARVILSTHQAAELVASLKLEAGSDGTTPKR